MKNQQGFGILPPEGSWAIEEGGETEKDWEG